MAEARDANFNNLNAGRLLFPDRAATLPIARYPTTSSPARFGRAANPTDSVP